VAKANRQSVSSQGIANAVRVAFKEQAAMLLRASCLAQQWPVTMLGGKVETRIAHAENDATYLLAKVEVIATYKLSNLHRIRLENVFHRIFAPAQLDLTIEDRFGHPVKPREWFLVPLHVIDEAVSRIRDGSITDFVYDTATAGLVKGVAPGRPNSSHTNPA
jgi:hypothetical protein